MVDIGRQIVGLKRITPTLERRCYYGDTMPCIYNSSCSTTFCCIEIYASNVLVYMLYHTLNNPIVDINV